MQKQLNLFAQSELTLQADSNQNFDETNSINEFFQRKIASKGIYEYKNFLEFIGRFKNYSLYNNMLVYFQNPQTEFYATASEWKKKFNRFVNENAEPMIILAPMTPVLLVYDLHQTEGEEFVFHQNEFLENKNDLSENAFELLLFNLSQLNIDVAFQSMNLESQIEIKSNYQKEKLLEQISIKINKSLSVEISYLKIINEIAKIYLGYEGKINSLKIISREETLEKIKELEIFTVLFLLNNRVNLNFDLIFDLNNFEIITDDLKKINIDLVIKTSAFIEKICRKKLKIKNEQ